MSSRQERREARILRLKQRFPSKNKNKKAAAETIVSRGLANHIAKQVLARSAKGAAKWLKRSILPALPESSDWYKCCRKLARFLEIADNAETGLRDVAFDVFKDSGNVKLPFCSFSVLPGFTCPGAGSCLKFCYSFTAWRYPAAFFRQLQNTVLIRDRKDIVRNAFLSIKQDRSVRLYVDGDIEDVEQLEFWFRTMGERPDLACYGYSKSWEVFLSADVQAPANYCLNLSAGSKYDNSPDILERMESLKAVDGTNVARGRFVGVDVHGQGFPNSMMQRVELPEYHQAVRESAREEHGTPKVFSCPGPCGECNLNRGKHACGDKSFPVLIALGIH